MREDKYIGQYRLGSNFKFVPDSSLLWKNKTSVYANVTKKDMNNLANLSDQKKITDQINLEIK